MNPIAELLPPLDLSTKVDRILPVDSPTVRISTRELHFEAIPELHGWQRSLPNASVEIDISNVCRDYAIWQVAVKDSAKEIANQAV